MAGRARRVDGEKAGKRRARDGKVRMDKNIRISRCRAVHKRGRGRYINYKYLHVNYSREHQSAPRVSVNLLRPPERGDPFIPRRIFFLPPYQRTFNAPSGYRPIRPPLPLLLGHTAAVQFSTLTRRERNEQSVCEIKGERNRACRLKSAVHSSESAIRPE